MSLNLWNSVSTALSAGGIMWDEVLRPLIGRSSRTRTLALFLPPPCQVSQQLLSVMAAGDIFASGTALLRDGHHTNRQPGPLGEYLVHMLSLRPSSF